MAPRNFIQNPYLMLLYCLIFVFLASFTIKINPAMYIAIFILIAIITFLIRPLTELYLKPTCYFLLGSLSFWMIARELVISPGGPEPALFVLFGLVLLNGLVSLIAYSDGQISGQSFIAGSLLLLFLNLSDPHTFLSGVLIFAASSGVVYFVFKITDKRKMPEKVITASIISSLFLYAAAMSQLWNGISMGVYHLPSAFAFGSSLVYLVALSAFAIWLTISVFDFFLLQFGYARSVKGDSAVYSLLPGRSEKPEKKQKARR